MPLMDSRPRFDPFWRKGLVFNALCDQAGNVRDVVRGISGTWVGTQSGIMTPMGPAMKADYTGTSYVKFPNFDYNPTVSKAVTFAVAFQYRGATTYQPCFGAACSDIADGNHNQNIFFSGGANSGKGAAPYAAYCNINGYGGGNWALSWTT